MPVVQVTPSDLVEGEPRNTGKCPLALAIGRAFGVGQRCVSVDYSRWYAVFVVRKNSTEYGAMIQRKVTRSQLGFMEAFDRGENVSPIDFQVDLTDEEIDKLRRLLRIINDEISNDTYWLSTFYDGCYRLNCGE